MWNCTTPSSSPRHSACSTGMWTGSERSLPPIPAFTRRPFPASSPLVTPARIGTDKRRPAATGSGRIRGMTQLPARLSIVTLGARDMGVLRSFYRSLGWRELPSGDDTWTGFLLGGVLLALFPIRDLTSEAAPGTADPTGWSGVTLACAVNTREEVESVFAAAVAAGATPVAAA